MGVFWCGHLEALEHAPACGGDTFPIVEDAYALTGDLDGDRPKEMWA